MLLNKKIRSALISVFDKEGLEPIVKRMNELGITIYSTGGTQEFIEKLEIKVHAVENLTGYPSILGGRVKTLHPKVFGGILARRENVDDQNQLAEFDIPEIDVVVVDLYPFEKTVALGASHEEIVEKIDIGGVSLIRAAAKNYAEVVIVASKNQYSTLRNILDLQQGESSAETRKILAREAFDVTSHYDSAIFNYFCNGEVSSLKISEQKVNVLRYGENPHQKGIFYGDLESVFDKLSGKELSYNNLLDVDAAIMLMSEFRGNDPVFAILKHNNACGVAYRKTISEAFEAAMAADPVSAFGGILISNATIDVAAAEKINPLFCEVVIAPRFEPQALEILRSKPNRILLVQKKANIPDAQIRTLLNGYIWQERDTKSERVTDMELVTNREATASEMSDLIFANKIVKHTKSNTIVLAKYGQLCASGTGQTSRVDALQQAIAKAQSFDFDLEDAVMASDAFFPFPDCVEIAYKAGIRAVVQPGGSIKDYLSIEYCKLHDMAMYVTGVRHFKH